MHKVLLFLFCLVLSTAAMAKKPKQIVILHTNDTHSQVLPFNPNLMDTVKAGRAGYLRRVNYVKAEREANPQLLLLDSGDFSQGSPFYTMFKGDVEVGLMNLMKYDVVTIGNHEFDYGMENMARLFRMGTFQVVCANYDFTGTVCESLVKPYTIIKRNGVKIGIFGLSPRMEGLVAVKNSEGVKFLDPMAKAKEMVQVLRKKEKCDVVICLSHLGYKTGDGEISDDMVAAETEGIDIFLGGHTHSYLKKPALVNNKVGKPTPIDQNGKSGIYMSKLTFNIDKK